MTRQTSQLKHNIGSSILVASPGCETGVGCSGSSRSLLLELLVFGLQTKHARTCQMVYLKPAKLCEKHPVHDHDSTTLAKLTDPKQLSKLSWALRPHPRKSRGSEFFEP